MRSSCPKVPSSTARTRGAASWDPIRRLLAVSWLLLCLGAASACQGASASPEPSLNGTELALSGGPNRVGVPITGGGEAASNLAAGEDGDDEPKDYWAAIAFDRSHFDEVRDQVRQRYIDPEIDETRAWGEAAAFALASDEETALYLVPKSFYEARKDDEDEDGRLDGEVIQLEGTDRFVILDSTAIREKEKTDAEAKDAEAKDADAASGEDEPKSLTDKEIRELREREQKRTRLLDQAWKETRFGPKDFERCMKFAEGKLGKAESWSMKKAWVAAAQGYLYSLDPHSSLIAKAAWEDSTRETTDSSFEGIGAILTRRPDSDYTIVESPLEGQPAVAAGLRAGDTILKVDGKDIKGELLPKVVSRIRGPKATKVVLTVRREGVPDPLDIGITRAHIDIKNVQGRLVKGYAGIGYVKVTGFVPTTNSELGRVVGELADEAGGELKGLILDLRNNSGGLLKEGIKVADRFLDDGVIVSVRNRDSVEEVHRATKGPGTWTMPLVVLVNSGSASASEILASAMQDNGRGLVVGDRTFGKASVQTLFSPLLRDDYYIKLTVARFYAPSGRTLQVLGVSPDLPVTPELDGEMPLGFREENLSHHLPPLDVDTTSKNAAWAKRIGACATKSGQARKIHAADPNPAVKFDHQLMLAADHLTCMAAETRGR